VFSNAIHNALDVLVVLCQLLVVYLLALFLFGEEKPRNRNP
jgi:hypothetical protein